VTAHAFTTRSIVLAAALVAAGCGRSCGGSHRDVPRAEPEPEAGVAPTRARAMTPAKAPPAAPAKLQATIGRGPSPVHPARVPLLLAPGLAPLDPPMRVQRVLAVPGRPLAVVSGLSADGPVVELVDVDRATIKWRNTSCGAPAVHATPDRIVCAAWQGMKGLSVDTGEALWSSPMAYRAARERWLVARDPADDKTGAILDAQTGKTLLELMAPENETFDEVHALCRGDRGFDVYAWSLAGVLRRINYPKMRNTASPGKRVWARRLSRAPATIDPCDPIVLVELPNPGQVARTLYAIHQRGGNDAVRPIAENGFWTEGTGIAVANADGVTLRSRTLEEKSTMVSGVWSGRLVARDGDLRLLRAPGDTLLLVDDKGPRAWMAAPARVFEAIITQRRVLTGGWLMPPQSNVESPLLYELPGRGNGPPALPLPAPGVAHISEPPPQRVPPRPTWKPSTYQRPATGTYAVTHPILANHHIYALAFEKRPSATSGGGVAAFDLASRKWQWSAPSACAEKATPIGVAAARDVVVCAAAENFPGPGHLRAVDATTGAERWRLDLPTVDRIEAGGAAVVAVYGTRAAVIDAAKGKVVYEIDSDNGYLPQIAVATDGDVTRVVAVEPGGRLVARDPVNGAPAWVLGINGYVRQLIPRTGGVAVQLAIGELVLVDAADGKARSLPDLSSGWMVRADEVVDQPPASEGVSVVRAIGTDGAERFRTAMAITPPLDLARLREPGGALVLVSQRGEGRIIDMGPTGGKVRASYAFPDGMVLGSVFSTVVAGKPILGAVVQKPLGVVLF